MPPQEYRRSVNWPIDWVRQSPSSARVRDTRWEVKMRHPSRTHREYPRQRQVGRKESPRGEASSHWTLSNEISILDHASLALMRMPSGCSQPHRTGHGFTLGLPDNSSPKTMVLTPSGVHHTPSPRWEKPANEGRKPPPRRIPLDEKGSWERPDLKL